MPSVCSRRHHAPIPFLLGISGHLPSPSALTFPPTFRITFRTFQPPSQSTFTHLPTDLPAHLCSQRSHRLFTHLFRSAFHSPFPFTFPSHLFDVFTHLSTHFPLTFSARFPLTFHLPSPRLDCCPSASPQASPSPPKFHSHSRLLAVPTPMNKRAMAHPVTRVTTTLAGLKANTAACPHPPLHKPHYPSFPSRLASPDPDPQPQERVSTSRDVASNPVCRCTPS